MYRMRMVSATAFLSVFQRARAADPQIERHTVDLSGERLGGRYKCYLVEEIKPGSLGMYPMPPRVAVHNAGFVIENGGKRRLRCMFNATGPVTGTERHPLGSFMVKQAIQLGARSLNCPADWREKLYRKHGFKEVNRLVFMELEGGTHADEDEMG